MPQTDMQMKFVVIPDVAAGLPVAKYGRRMCSEQLAKELDEKLSARHLKKKAHKARNVDSPQ